MSHFEFRTDYTKNNSLYLLTADEIYTQYGDSLWRLTLAYESDEELRKDLFQEIMIAIWQALSRFKGKSSIKTYIYRIAHNRCISHSVNQKKVRNRFSSIGDAVMEIEGTSDNPEKEIENRELKAEINELISRMSPKIRQVFVMHLEQIANKEIAEILGLKENTVAVRIKRGKQLLMEKLK